jgi:hypothetical protein
MRRHSDSSCLLMVTPDARVGIKAMDVPGIVRRLRVQVAGYPLVLAGGDAGWRPHHA